jgi:hypothetical protein
MIDDAKIYTHKCLDEAFAKLEEIRKTMKKPMLKNYDDPKHLILGWMLQDGTNEKTAQYVSLPDNFVHKVNCMLREENLKRGNYVDFGVDFKTRQR